MNFNKDHNKKFKYIIILITVILMFFVISKLFMPDDREFPVETKYNEKITVDNYPLKTKNAVYDQEKKILQFSVDFYIDQFMPIDNNYRNEVKIFYADPKEEIDKKKIFHMTKLEQYKTSETEEKNKINITFQIKDIENLEKRLGIVISYFSYENIWNEERQKSMENLRLKYNLGFDYREIKYAEVEEIKESKIDEKSQNYIDYLKMKKNTEIQEYTSEGAKISEENSTLTEEDESDLIDENLRILNGELQEKEKLIEQYKETNNSGKLSKEGIEANQKVIESYENDVKDIKDDINYYESLKTNE